MSLFASPSLSIINLVLFLPLIIDKSSGWAPPTQVNFMQAEDNSMSQNYSWPFSLPSFAFPSLPLPFFLFKIYLCVFGGPGSSLLCERFSLVAERGLLIAVASFVARSTDSRGLRFQ